MSTIMTRPPRVGKLQHERTPDGQNERPALPVRRPGGTLPQHAEQQLAALLTRWSQQTPPPAAGRRLVMAGWL